MLLTALRGKILQMRTKNCQKGGFYPQGLAVTFSHRQVYVKREGRTFFAAQYIPGDVKI
jgi:hypothetical protein